jgi:hypothetical protein
LPGALLVAAVVPVLGGVYWLSETALRLGTANSITSSGLQLTEKWYLRRVSPGGQELDAMASDLSRAIQLSPADPGLRELLGIMELRRARSGEAVERAHGHLASALVMRPTSSYAWANVVVASYQLGRTNEVFEAALRNAVLMGPSEPEVQAVVADHGLAVWDEVAPGTRAAIESAIAAGMKRNPMEMLKISVRRGRLQPACGHLWGSRRTPDPKWLTLCTGRGSK